MANSAASSASTPDGISHQDVAKDHELRSLKRENKRLRKELTKARGIIERQNRQLQSMRRNLGEPSETIDAATTYPHSPTSVADHESSSCSSVGTSQKTACSVIFIEGRKIPEVYEEASNDDDSKTRPLSSRHGDPPSSIQIEQDDAEDVILSAKVSRRVSSITMAEAMSPLLVEATAIRDGKAARHCIEATGIAPAMEEADKALSPTTSQTTEKKRLVRKPTPIPSFSSSETSDEDATNGDATHSTNGKDDFKIIRSLFSVKEDSDVLVEDSGSTSRTEFSLDGIAGPPVKPSSLKAAADGCGSDARANSDVTQKASNTTTSVFDAMHKTRPKQPAFTSQSPPPPVKNDRKAPRDAPGLAPPKRTESPLPQANAHNPDKTVSRPNLTLEVENHPLADASGEQGVYTGSMDSKTLLPDGFGTMIYNRGDQVYTGDWEQGQYHGYGKFTSSQGDVYDGPFVQGLKEGPDDATMNFHDGRRFKGRFHGDKMREGILQFVDGSSYEGLLENNKRNGFGLYCFQNGDQYEGQWKNDLMHGRGRMEWKSDGAWYNGDWEFGIQHGMGTEADANGRIIHQGHFHQGQPVSYAEPVYDDDDE